MVLMCWALVPMGLVALGGFGYLKLRDARKFMNDVTGEDED